MTVDEVTQGAAVLTVAFCVGFTTVAFLVRNIAALFEAGKGRSL